MDTPLSMPQDRSLREALWLATIFASIKLLLHIVTNIWQAHLGYGFFRDEMYYIICGRRLAWGYVDHTPLVALQARLTTALFGNSLAGVRMLTSVAGAGRVFITGILAWALGGRRPAQALAMIGVLCNPQFLSIDSFLSMNSVEPIFWMTCLLAIILMQRGVSERLCWLAFGISAGLGELNKPSITFFLIAMMFALLLTPQRRLLYSRWAVIAMGLLILIALPNVIWQMHHHWAMLEFLINAKHSGKNPHMAPWTYMGIQVLYMQPLTLLIWGAGLLWLLRGAEAHLWRWIGLSYIFTISIIIALAGTHYYISPIYPVLFAAGGIAWEHHFASRSAVQQNRVFAFPLMEGILIVLGVITLPWAIPVLSPQTWLRYMKATRLYDVSINAHGRAQNRLSLFFEDRFGWNQMVALVTHAYDSLSPEDQKKVGIICLNYGEASAINFLGHGLPFATSGDNTYYLWGPEGATGEVLISVTRQPPEVLQRVYDSVQIVGRTDNPYSIPAEHVNIYILRGRHRSLIEDWPRLKEYR